MKTKEVFGKLVKNDPPDKTASQNDDMQEWKTWGACYEPLLIKKDKDFKPRWDAHLESIAKMAKEHKKEKALPTVFISYAWPLEKHLHEERGLQIFLLQLREDLRRAGLIVYLDLKDLRNNENVFEFANKIEMVDYVLQPCTPSLFEKDVSLRYHVTHRELAHIRNRKDRDDHDLDSASKPRVYPFLFAGNRKNAVLLDKLYQDIVLDWRDKSYILNVYNVLNRFLPFLAQDDVYKAHWSSLIKETGYNKPMDKKAVLRLQKDMSLKKLHDKLSRETFYQDVVEIYLSKSPLEVSAAYKRKELLKKQSGFDAPVDYYVEPQAYEELFSALKDYLDNPKKMHLAITGIAGSGKTQLAAYLLERYFDHVSQHVTKEQLPVLYQLDMSNETNFKSDLRVLWDHMRVLAGEMKKGDSDLSKLTENEQMQIWREICRRLDEDYPGSVLLFDNVDEREVFDKFKMPAARRGDKSGLCVIVTSQDEKITINPQGIKASLSKGLGVPQALGLLENLSGLSTENDAKATQLVNELDYLPHSIVVAGSYVAEEKSNFSAYLSELNKSLSLLEEALRDHVEGMQNYNQTQLAVIALAVDKLISKPQKNIEDTNSGEVANKILQYSSLMFPTNIPVVLIERCLKFLEGVDAVQAKRSIRKGIRRAKAYSLLRSDYKEKDQMLHFHRSVQRVMWLKWDEHEEECMALGNGVIEALRSKLNATQNYDMFDLQRYWTYFPHLTQAMKVVQNLKVELTSLLRFSCLYDIGIVYTSMCEYKSALSSFEECAKVWMLLGPDKKLSDIIRLYSNIAGQNKALGNDDLSFQYLFASIALIEKAEDLADDLDVALTMTNYSTCLIDKYPVDKKFEYLETAFTYLTKSLDIRESHSPGTDQPEKAHIYNLIGNVMGYIGSFDQALLYHKMALDMLERQYPDQCHPDKLLPLFNISGDFFNLKNFPKALLYADLAFIMITNLYEEDSPAYKEKVARYNYFCSLVPKIPVPEQTNDDNNNNNNEIKKPFSPNGSRNTK